MHFAYLVLGTKTKRFPWFCLSYHIQYWHKPWIVCLSCHIWKCWDIISAAILIIFLANLKVVKCSRHSQQLEIKSDTWFLFRFSGGWNQLPSETHQNMISRWTILCLNLKNSHKYAKSMTACLLPHCLPCRRSETTGQGYIVTPFSNCSSSSVYALLLLPCAASQQNISLCIQLGCVHHTTFESTNPHHSGQTLVSNMVPITCEYLI